MSCLPLERASGRAGPVHVYSTGVHAIRVSAGDVVGNGAGHAGHAVAGRFERFRSVCARLGREGGEGRWDGEEIFNGDQVLTDSTPALEDFTCAICLSLYYEPTLLPSCHHRFCRTCIEQLPIYDPKTSSTPILPLLLDSADPQKSCPLCRTPFHPSSCVEDTALINFLKLYFPREMNGLRKERGSEQNKERIKKWIKNSAMAGAPALLMMAGAPVIYNVDHGGAWDVAGGREAEDERPSGFEMMSYVAWL
ncbi:hypothetical protein BC938DRAFT_477025 [Jimgerdemannia flammicorona]|uniref:RING-type domain-containing protein n=1 Tax=Jimgerdemannia flammicorona TaxID=994334 RepID=A0A433QPU5_9FUNG|nr:hypothetical protein BC938DRAFT_477025 [Jimgerdemannia flammicorona]